MSSPVNPPKKIPQTYLHGFSAPPSSNEPILASVLYLQWIIDLYMGNAEDKVPRKDTKEEYIAVEKPIYVRHAHSRAPH